MWWICLDIFWRFEDVERVEVVEVVEETAAGAPGDGEGAEEFCVEYN